MDQKEPTSNPKGVCEKLFNAFSVNPTFRSFRRISHHPQTPTPVAPTPPPPLPVAIDYNASSLGAQDKPNTLGKYEPVTGLGHTHGAQNKPNILGKNEEVTGLGHTHGSQNKPNTHGKNEPLMSFGHTHKPEKGKVPEAVVPTKADPQLPPPVILRNEKEKLTTAPVPTQEKVKNQVARVNSKTEPAPPYASLQEKGKPNPEVHLAPPLQGVAGQGKSNFAKVEPPPPPPPPQEVPRKAEDTIKTRSNSINDKASDYITRARTRLRTTTTVGAGRFTSFK
ncbi:hypothetical protein BVC80_1665g59 [Macleaya cordata]|uniref:Uncharacterized protein n=1 Tax=Macleaya cordata TaxID=56857 RepID=A0A200RBJ7_MACCD|nr:hypothetical protein BVC80_1665g59 [Macleaya cordata]